MKTNSVVEIENHSGYSVVRFFGCVDAATVEQVRPLINVRLPEACSRIIVDLSKVDFLDSHGVGFFVSLMKRVHSRQGRLFFSGATDQPASVLNMVGFNSELVTYCRDMSHALVAVA